MCTEEKELVIQAIEWRAEVMMLDIRMTDANEASACYSNTKAAG